MNGFLKVLQLGTATLILAACSPAIVVQRAPRQPIAPSKVRVYTSPPTSQYEVIADLNRPPLGGYNSGDFNRYAIKKLIKEAAALGANGLLLTAVGKSIPTASSHGTHGGWEGKPGFHVHAIFVSQSEPAGRNRR